MSPLEILWPAAVAVCVFMAFAWYGARRADKLAWVDVAWAFAFLLVIVAGWWAGSAPWERKLLVGVTAGLWSLRLGTHLAIRVGRSSGEDPRYEPLLKLAGPRPWPALFWFFQAQALSVLVLGIPFLLAFANGAPALAPLEWAGLAVALAGFGGEALADAQLAAFRSRTENRGRICQSGLWRYSRHPNYFFEWVIWIGFSLYGLAAPNGAIALLSPALMLLLLTKVTGIPPAEAQSLARRGEAYREYQRRTSAFIPLPPRGA